VKEIHLLSVTTNYGIWYHLVSHIAFWHVYEVIESGQRRFMHYYWVQLHTAWKIENIRLIAGKIWRDLYSMNPINSYTKSKSCILICTPFIAHSPCWSKGWPSKVEEESIKVKYMPNHTSRNLNFPTIFIRRFEEESCHCTDRTTMKI